MRAVGESEKQKHHVSTKRRSVQRSGGGADSEISSRRNGERDLLFRTAYVNKNRDSRTDYEQESR